MQIGNTGNRRLDDGPEVYSPKHYTAGRIETIDKIAVVVTGVRTPLEGYLLGNAVKYIDRAGSKGEPTDWNDDLHKAANYIHRLVYGKWVDEDMGEQGKGAAHGRA